MPRQISYRWRRPQHFHRRRAHAAPGRAGHHAVRSQVHRLVSGTPERLCLPVLAALVLLYAQPVSRIVRLTIDDVTDDETTDTVQLGDPPSPLPEPVAVLMRAYIQSRQHLPYASSRSSQWLFPGRQPGQPMNPVSLQVHLREIGVPPQRGRTSAIRQLVLQAPAPVIVKALGYHDKVCHQRQPARTATRLGTEAGGTWSRYAPGDHQR
ncbi:hypothetical protein [Streptomyces sp. NPDC047999]|uniref:hypothetical protein n=2 Tax=unclassified Streptomyces TaxID=2593676 RepID=UPI00371DDB97